MPATLPFWKTKTLEEMTPPQGGSLRGGCGRFCAARVEADDTRQLYWTDTACWLLDRRSCRCGDYANRKTLVPGCQSVKPDAAYVRQANWLPSSCGYRRVAEGRDLAWWHPLISGDPETVHRAGISVRGRVISDRLVSAIENHVTAWQEFDTDDPAGLPMHRRARFGGVNVAVPTPFMDSGAVDCARLARHCLWLLSRGCDGLVLFAAEGNAVLDARARLDVLHAVIARKVPVSRLWPVFDAADPGTAAVLASMMAGGCRGALLAPGASAQGLAALLADEALPILYPILAPGMDAVALAPLARAMGERLPGLFLPGADAAAVGRVRVALTDTGLCGAGPEIYVGAGGFGAAALAAGAAGVISPLANIASRLLARLRAGTAADPAVSAARLAALVAALAAHDEMAAVRALLARAWRDPAWEQSAPGGRALDPGAKAALFAAVDAAAR